MRINVKLTICVGIIASIATCVLAYTSHKNMLKSTLKENDRIIASLSATVYETASIAAYLDNESLASDVISGLLKNRQIICAELITNKMSVSSDINCKNISSEDEVYIETLYSPFNQTEVIGQIKIFKNLEQAQQIANALANNKIQGIALVAIISILVTLVTTYFLVSHPIEKLAAWLDSVKLNNTQSERYPHTNRVDEIGKIGFKINQLLNKLDERLNKERALTRQTQKLSENFQMICNLSKNALLVTDKNLKLISYNPVFEALTEKYSVNPLVQNAAQWLSDIFENSDSIIEQILSNQKERQPVTIEVESKHIAGQDSGNSQWFELTFSKAENMFGELNIFIFINDVTTRRQQLLQSEFEADHDLLTNLKNRRATRRLLHHMLQNPDAEIQLALLVIDLDGFKAVNDTYGHDAGDLVLTKIARRLSILVRRSDILARWGGDEFVIALNYSTQADAETIASKVIEIVSKPITLDDNNRAELGASIGIAMYPQSAANFDDLFEQADQAMYQVKKSGKNTYSVFQQSRPA